MLSVRDLPRLGDDRLEHRRHGHHVDVGLRRLRARLETCQQQQVVDEHLHAFRRRTQACEQSAQLFLIERFVVERLEIAENHGQRRAQLMRHVGDEVLSHAEQPVQLRNVARQNQHARFVDVDPAHFELQIGMCRGDFDETFRRLAVRPARRSPGFRTSETKFWPTSRDDNPSSVCAATLNISISPLRLMSTAPSGSASVADRT